MITVTLVTPLRNERDSIECLWRAIVTQSRSPEEWIIADNGSTDGTYEWLLAQALSAPFPVTVLSLPGLNIATMMNTMIQSAQHTIIACCHGGTEIPNSWLENLIKPIEKDPSIEVSAGTWKAMGTTKLSRFVAQHIKQERDRLHADSYLPAARSIAFQKQAWHKVGGFPEWLPMFGEDTLYDIRLHIAGCKFVIAADAEVGWYQKPTLRSLCRQYYLYAEADSIMGLKTRRWKGFIRPWNNIVIILLGWMISSSLTLGLATAFVLAILDCLRWLHLGYIKSPLVYAWYSLISIPSQLGFFRGKWLLFTDKVKVPEGDRAVITRWLATIKPGTKIF